MNDDGLIKRLLTSILRGYNSVGMVPKILCGVILGVLIALLNLNFTALSLLGTLFVSALKSIAPLLVFVIILASISQNKGGLGSRFRLVIFYYLLSTLLAAVVASLACDRFPIMLTLDWNSSGASGTVQSVSTVVSNILQSVTTNPVSALTDAQYLPILFWAIVLGIAVKKVGSSETKSFLLDCSNALSHVTRWIIALAPFGIMGLVYSAVASEGVSIFKEYGKLALLIVACVLVVALIVNPIIVAISLRRNPYPLVWKCLRMSGVTAFFTRSSAANIPVNMAVCEKLGVDRDFYSVAIPLGAVINMNGAAITISVMTLTAAHSLGLDVSFTTSVWLCVISALAACGASGIAGGSLLLIPMACSLFNIPNDVSMQVVGVGFVIGVVQDSFETALNSSGDVLFVTTAEYRRIMKEVKEDAERGGNIGM